MIFISSDHMIPPAMAINIQLQLLTCHLIYFAFVVWCSSILGSLSRQQIEIIKKNSAPADHQEAFSDLVHHG